MAEELKMKYPYLHLVGSDEDPIYYRAYRDKPDHYEPLTHEIYLNNQYVFRIDDFDGLKHIHMANGEFYRVKSYTVKYT